MINRCQPGEDDRLNQQLLNRGWIAEADAIDATWRWPHPNNPIGVDLLYPSPIIWFEEGQGVLVEGPLLHDFPTPLLCYRTAADLLARIDQIERWTYPQTPYEIDADHTQQPTLAGNPPLLFSFVGTHVLQQPGPGGDFKRLGSGGGAELAVEALALVLNRRR